MWTLETRVIQFMNTIRQQRQRNNILLKEYHKTAVRPRAAWNQLLVEQKWLGVKLFFFIIIILNIPLNNMLILRFYHSWSFISLLSFSRQSKFQMDTECIKIEASKLYNS